MLRAINYQSSLFFITRLIKNRYAVIDNLIPHAMILFKQYLSKNLAKHKKNLSFSLASEISCFWHERVMPKGTVRVRVKTYRCTDVLAVGETLLFTE